MCIRIFAFRPRGVEKIEDLRLQLLTAMSKKDKTQEGEFSGGAAFSKEQQEQWKLLMASTVAEALAAQSSKEQPQNQTKLAKKKQVSEIINWA